MSRDPSRSIRADAEAVNRTVYFVNRKRDSNVFIVCSRTVTNTRVIFESETRCRGHGCKLERLNIER